MAMPRWVYAALRRIELAAAYAQGKGYGSGTVVHEVAMVAASLERPPALAVDIGAHGGSYLRALRRRFPDLEIHAIEPSSVNQRKLRERHGDDPRVTIVPAAVSGSAGEATLWGDAPGSGLASLHRRRLDHYDMPFDVQERVPTIRFEDYWRDALGSRPIDIVKMDIEGHELQALGAFGDALPATSVLQFEFGGTNIDSRTYFQDFFYLFRQAGFSLHRITPFGLEAIDRYREADEFFFTINYLAVNRATRRLG